MPAARRERSPDGMDTLGGMVLAHRPERTDADYMGFHVVRASFSPPGPLELLSSGQLVFEAALLAIEDDVHGSRLRGRRGEINTALEHSPGPLL